MPSYIDGKQLVLQTIFIAAVFALIGGVGRMVTEIKHIYEVRPRKDKRGVDLISKALPFGRLWYGEPNAISNAIG